MAGHIAGLGYSQRMDVNGDPLAGCKLYIYTTGTSTPATVYQDYSLSIEHSFPIVADAAGIVPMFWVADGTYRVRLTDSAGVEVFDDDGIVAIGPSSGSGGGGSSTPTSAIFTTGDVIWVPVSGTRSGWVRSNGRTVGSSASGATERANADCEELFSYLWNNFGNSLCAVSSGRGANAAADWSANKTIATLDMRDKGPWGLSDMGNTSTGSLGTTAGASGGALTATLAQANLPNVNFSNSLTAATHTHGVGTYAVSSHTHGVGTFSVNITDPGHTHSYTRSNIDNDTRTAGSNSNNKGSTTDNTASGTTGITASLSGASASATPTLSGSSAASGSIAVSGTVSSGGSATPVSIMPPYVLGSWYMKL